ncbi:MAG: LysM peptidoglycan-binding domain-containing protein [Anaerolineae bacterium]|nr:LysM peptidoglycan-binding domain-containing protein [Anaerolineae bacterium]
MKPRRRNNSGTLSIMIAVIGAVATVIIALEGTFFVSSRIPNLPTTTSTAAIALSPFKTFLPLTDTATPPPDLLTQIIEETYIVQRDDTFEEISERFFGSRDYAAAIQKSNCIDTIRRNQEITIKYYVIKNGDDVFEIADRLNINYQRLRYINTNQNELIIYPGQYLILPVSNICS